MNVTHQLAELLIAFYASISSFIVPITAVLLAGFAIRFPLFLANAFLWALRGGFAILVIVVIVAAFMAPH